ncbi:hypothetical protein MMC25_003519 [Agyrium rufum]|nr:hypothetical protein [Agyrium rufum]
MSAFGKFPWRRPKSRTEEGRDKRPNSSASTSPGPSTPAPATQEMLGLSVLAAGDGEQNVDVVAVHGLQGDAYKTWQHDNGAIWLREFLPHDIPSARIMTFGYNSTVAFSNSVVKLEDKAIELLNRLSLKRSKISPNRPIVFVCHSLGGIVVKKALILAHERSSDPDFRDILQNTKAIAFLGVPHRGSGSAFWANFAGCALKAASVGITTNTALVADLRKDSTTLTNISKQFVERGQNLIVYTFYETQKLAGVLVVDENSARIGLPNEKLFPVDASHKTICKISIADGQEYEAVGTWVAKLVKLATETHTTNLGQRVAVLKAMGGQGKTQIALKFCRQKRDNPLTTIFWVDATSQTSTIGSYQTISDFLKSKDDQLDTADTRVSFVRRTLSSRKIKWLLVFDNYDNPREFPNIRDFFPDRDHGAVLITSRHADSLELASDPAGAIEVPGLPRKTVVKLLLDSSNTTDSNNEDAKAVIERLGRHPLAIIQAAAYIRKRKLPFSRFLHDFRGRMEKILAETPAITAYTKKLDDSAQETAFNVFTTLELSFGQLQAEKGHDSLEAKLLTLLAFLDDEDISEQILARSAAFIYTKAHLEDLGDILGWLRPFTDNSHAWATNEFEDRAVYFKGLSLLQACDREEDNYLHIYLHPLIKDWIQLRASSSDCEKALIGAFILIKNYVLVSLMATDIRETLSSKYFVIAHNQGQLNSFEFYVTKYHARTKIVVIKHLLNLQSWFVTFEDDGGTINHEMLLLGAGSLPRVDKDIFHLKEVHELRKKKPLACQSDPGPEHLHAIMANIDLVKSSTTLGLFQEAYDLQKKTTRWYNDGHGLFGYYSIFADLELAICLRNLGKFKETYHTLGAVLNKCRKIWNKAIPNFAAVMTETMLLPPEKISNGWEKTASTGRLMTDSGEQLLPDQFQNTLQHVSNTVDLRGSLENVTSRDQIVQHVEVAGTNISHADAVVQKTESPERISNKGLWIRRTKLPRPYPATTIALTQFQDQCRHDENAGLTSQSIDYILPLDSPVERNEAKRDSKNTKASFGNALLSNGEGTMLRMFTYQTRRQDSTRGYQRAEKYKDNMVVIQEILIIRVNSRGEVPLVTYQVKSAKEDFSIGPRGHGTCCD